MRDRSPDQPGSTPQGYVGAPTAPATAHQPAPADEALRRSVAADLGPRRPGAVYTTPAGQAFEVLDVITDRAEARRITGRRTAQFAVLTIELSDDDWNLHTTSEPWRRDNVLTSYGTTRRDPR